MAGEMTEDDLIVLLSERAAREIYKKWLDTLHVSDTFDVHCILNKCMCMFMRYRSAVLNSVCCHMCANTLCYVCVFYAMLQFFMQAKKIGYRVQSEIIMTQGDTKSIDIHAYWPVFLFPNIINARYKKKYNFNVNILRVGFR